MTGLTWSPAVTHATASTPRYPAEPRHAGNRISGLFRRTMDGAGNIISEVLVLLGILGLKPRPFPLEAYSLEFSLRQTQNNHLLSEMGGRLLHMTDL